jgi:hypothetical protein
MFQFLVELLALLPLLTGTPPTADEVAQENAPAFF